MAHAMQQPLPSGAPRFAAPSFYLTVRQPLRPGVILLAIAAAVGGLCSIGFALEHTRRAHFGSGGDGSGRASSGTEAAGDDKDDPSQVDTIVLGDPADAPVSARRGDHVSPVHATILVRLPRFGDQVGLIPNSPAGHLLYGWLAAFNQGSSPALDGMLPTVAGEPATAAQMELRRETGGFNLLSAKEVEPGVLVFRLRDQTRAGTEALGTLVMRPNSSPAAIGSFSLRGVAGR